MCTIKENSYVYILCNRHRNVLYIGATNEIKKRIYFHKKRLIDGFTRKYNVDRLVYFEKHNDMDAALVREKQLKGYRRERKVDLIDEMNPDWNDLYETIKG